ncbi:hypothetical protein C8R47DRAFT_1160333 [Mycena vitilis]|nr:hypothetical protein C8R47DRAFT_1160333 [Mycena vitilis]
MHLFEIPPELRSLIYDFCFPPPQTYVQIVPYRTSLPACRLNLPVALYLVCKLITSELERLPAKLRRLDLTYIIRGSVLHGGWRPEYGPKYDEDNHHDYFATIMRFAERVRLVGSGPTRTRGRAVSAPIRRLTPGPECALKVLEVQPCAWRKRVVARVMLTSLGPLTTHPDVAARLELRLIREPKDPLDDVEQLLRKYMAWKESVGSAAGPVRVNQADLDAPVKEVKTNLRKIETWLKRLQATKGANLMQRSDHKGPLGGDSDEDDPE